MCVDSRGCSRGAPGKDGLNEFEVLMSYCCSSSLARRRAIALVIVATLTSAYAAAADFSGKWSGSSPDNDSVGTMYAVLKQEGATLTGTAGPSESKQFQVITGRVDGDHLQDYPEQQNRHRTDTVSPLREQASRDPQQGRGQSWRLRRTSATARFWPPCMDPVCGCRKL